MSAIDHGALTTPQYAISPLLVRGVQAVDPTLRTDQVLAGPLLRNDRALLACTATTTDTQTAALLAGVTPADVHPTGAARAAMAAYFDRNQLPRQANRAVPLFVERGTGDTLVTPAWTASAVRSLCVAGVTVTERVRPGGHVEDGDVATAAAWLADRFAGRPASDSCGGIA
ncbi:hypothetical protein [Tsukamurella soli]